VRIKNYLESMPNPQNVAVPEHIRLTTELYEQLKNADKDFLTMLDDSMATYENLDNFLADMYTYLVTIPNAISKTYFKHTQPQRQLFTAG
jgi:pyrroloquinoline quinone (PQQ) biosynthesis protein C